eukprot:gb/GFBE01045465.1/.p1 GENE.gb/GFBE01045465.1/~~gb/GFBE01045465.1/.p1  ORF type:complete len:470 (+),score=109.72 gb/GFBE01045465.1/:1-1410(+)
MVDFQGDIMEAMEADLGRPKAEILVAEYAAVIAELDMATSQLPNWSRPERVAQPLMQQPGQSAVHRVPKGVVLIISPWNYPINLSLVPVISALAAGNCVVVKPSEVAPRCALVVEKILRCLDEDAVQVVQGSIQETTELLSLKFDHIMYTGNGTVGKVVMRAAAEHLTPVTLELGGKSPAIIDDTANLQVVGRRLIWGKFLNCGQTCVAPDYVLVTEKAKEQVIAVLKATIIEFYGQDPSKSPAFGRIVNERHWERVQDLLHGHEGKVWSPESGGPAVRADRYIPPTLIVDPSPESKVMQEEIFGPVLPILTVKRIEDAIDFVNARDKPLALYMFSSSKRTVDSVLANTTSGGCCVNDCIYQIANPNLPFGGVGASGMGASHGRAGFEEFSHRRSVTWRPTWVDPSLRYPAYSEKKTSFLMTLLMGPRLPSKAELKFCLRKMVCGGGGSNKPGVPEGDASCDIQQWRYQ